MTAVESLRAQLAEANEKINNLSAEVHDRKGGLRHNQLEELRNLQVGTLYLRMSIVNHVKMVVPGLHIFRRNLFSLSLFNLKFLNVF